MAFHLEGPWLTTTGKHKTKRKWTSSEAKKLAQKQQADWDRKLVEFDKLAPKFSTGPYNVMLFRYFQTKKPKISVLCVDNHK